MRFEVRDESENIVASPDHWKTGPSAIRLKGGHQKGALPLHHGAQEEAKMVRGANVHLALRFWPRIDYHQVIFVLLILGCPHFLKDSLKVLNLNSTTSVLLCGWAGDARGRTLSWVIGRRGRNQRAVEKQHCWEASADSGSSIWQHFPSSPPLRASSYWPLVPVPPHSACGKRFWASR